MPREVDIGVEALIDTPSCEEASKNSSSEVQTVQLDIERWYLLFENTNSATLFLSRATSSFIMITLAAASSKPCQHQKPHRWTQFAQPGQQHYCATFALPDHKVDVLIGDTAGTS